MKLFFILIKKKFKSSYKILLLEKENYNFHKQKKDFFILKKNILINIILNYALIISNFLLF